MHQTLVSVINHLYKEFIVTKQQTIILREGDQAKYERLQSLKAGMVCPFSRRLAPFEEVLVKNCFDAGLVDLAKSSGYTTNSVASNFIRTHHSLVKVWESLYQSILSLFLEMEKTRRLQQTFSRLLQTW